MQFTDGFSDASVAPDTPPAPNEPFFGDVIKCRVTWDGDGNPDVSFSAAIRVPGAVTQCGVVLVTTAGQLAATSGGFPPSDSDPNVLNIYANWEPAPGQVLTAPHPGRHLFQQRRQRDLRFRPVGAKAAGDVQHAQQ